MALPRALLLAALLARAAAQVPYTQTQAASFLTSSNDVLAAVAPSVDPTHKLAAQTSVTLPVNASGPWSSLAHALGGQTYAVVEAQRVVAFMAVVNAPDALLPFVAKWAGVPTANVLLSTDNAFAQPPVYNVTVYPQQDAADAGMYSAPIDYAKELVNRLPPCLTGVQNCICNMPSLLTAGSAVVLQSTSTPCADTFKGAAVAYRYRIDLFSDYDVPNARTVDAVTALFRGLSTSAGLITGTRRLPGSTLQFITPVAEYTAGPLSLTGTVAASLGVSAVVLAIGLVMWYRSRNRVR